MKTAGSSCFVWTVQLEYQRVPPAQKRVLEVVLSPLVQLEANLLQDVLAAHQIRICVCLGIFVRVVSPEERHECPHGFCCIASTPVVSVEHVAYFWGSDGANEADDARYCLLA